MELHSYAKRRTSKKWSVEQKRKLVEIRIAYDSIFEQQPNQSLTPWNKILSMADLEDYNVFFVRKQWANMIDKYKQLKENRLGDMPTKLIDNEMIEKLTEEWEFFKTIHQFMTRKTTNLHSYALTKEPPSYSQNNKEEINNENLKQQQEQQLQQKQQRASLWYKPDSNSSNNSRQATSVYTSDENTNEDYAAAVGIKNDHDFYSKKQQSICDSNKSNIVNRDIDVDVHVNNVERRLHNILNSNQDDANEPEEDSQQLMLVEMNAINAIVINTTTSQTTPEETVALEDSKYLNHLELDQQTNEKQTSSINYNININHHQQHPSLITMGDSVDHTNVSVLSEEQLNSQHIKDEPLDHDITMTHCDDNIQPKSDKDSVSEGSESFFHSHEHQRYHRVHHRHHDSHSRTSAISHHLTERDKYYRHKRRFNRRLEKRFDALLNVFGHIVKSEYPSIDVSPLTHISSFLTNRNLTSQIKNLAGKVFSSSDEMATSSSEDDEQPHLDNNSPNENENDLY